MLEVKDLNAWYGESHVLQGVNFEVREGEVVTLLGRNGAGKTTTMRSLMGLVAKRKGSVRFANRETIGMSVDAIARQGMALCPEERAIFASLSVTENLMLPPRIAAGGLGIDEIHALFPNLVGRGSTRGTRLSGGEQQMLAIGRILRTGAKLLLLDEPTEGLAPVVVKQIADTIKAIRDRGFTILLVEQNHRFAIRVADRHYVMEHGRIIDMMSAAELDSKRHTLSAYLGV